MFASWKKTYDQPGQNIKNQRHYFAGKVLFSQTIGFPLVMYGCQSWTINKAECSRIDAFELWCWRTLESPLDCKEIQSVHPKRNQLRMFIGRTDAEAEAPYFGHLIRRTDSLEKTLMLGMIEGRRRGQQRMRWLDGITDLMNMNLSNSGSWWWTGKSGVLQSMGSQKVGHNWTTEVNWTGL